MFNPSNPCLNDPATLGSQAEDISMEVEYRVTIERGCDFWPLMDNEQMRDQFAFRPTGSTTAALIELMHLLYSMFDQGNDCVRLS